MIEWIKEPEPGIEWIWVLYDGDEETPYMVSQLSGYKSNRFNWLEKDGSGSCDFDSLNT